ncbi:MAG: hypothetical protein ACKOB4_17350 [Acidobacteriota bacterium]
MIESSRMRQSPCRFRQAAGNRSAVDSSGGLFSVGGVVRRRGNREPARPTRVYLTHEFDTRRPAGGSTSRHGAQIVTRGG